MDDYKRDSNDTTEESNQRESFVTLLTSDSYLPAVLVLDLSLKRVGSRRGLLVLVTPEISRKTIECLGNLNINVRLVDPILNPVGDEHLKNVWRILRGKGRLLKRYSTVYTKLRIWELAEYKKLIFLDSDMMLVRNIDDLFGCPNWSAVISGGELRQYRDWRGLNAGLLVIEPSLAVFRDMMSKIRILKSGDWGDQGFLHAYFPEWGGLEHLHLPHIYNMPVDFFDGYADQLGYGLSSKGVGDSKAVKVLHFWGDHKPWETNPRELNLSLFQRKPFYFRSFCLWLSAYCEVCQMVAKEPIKSGDHT